jgi:site-specific DNA-methyltransferase (adenine-specific)
MSEEIANKILCGDSSLILKNINDGFVDLVVTSPPYGSNRDYKGYSWSFENISNELTRILKPGGVIVWNECDQVVDGSESGTSFRHALSFMDNVLKLHDTMIYERVNTNFPSVGRYEQMFEYMFVLSNGKPKIFNPIIKQR